MFSSLKEESIYGTDYRDFARKTAEFYNLSYIAGNDIHLSYVYVEFTIKFCLLLNLFELRSFKKLFSQSKHYFQPLIGRRDMHAKFR